MTNTCEGEGVGDGSELTLGAVRTVGDEGGVGLGCVWAVPCVQAATVTSVVKLTSRRWVMEVRPERGGRITSLRLDGEELLDQGIGVDQPTANGFVEGGAFGWDEMVPNLEPTDELPDHGEAWRVPWEVVDAETMRASGRLVPWRLERKIELGESVVVSYVYVNAGGVPHGAFWCAHPLLKYDPEVEVSVPIPALGQGQSTKLFLPRGSLDRVRVRWPSGTGILLGWDPVLTPDVAIWVCNGDLGGYRQMAVEPATVAPQLEPGAALRWWLRVDPL